MVFLCGQTFSFDCQLKHTTFSDLINSKQFFTQWSNTEQFFSPFISFDSGLLTMILDKGSF